MAELLYGFDAHVSAWVAERIEHVRGGDFGPSAAIGVISGDRMIAGCVFHDFQSDFRTIQLSMAADSPMWARREIIRGLLAYPFQQLGCFKVWTATPAENTAALKVNLHIGFRREAILAHQFGPKRHGIICRFLEPDFRRLYGVA